MADCGNLSTRGKNSYLKVVSLHAEKLGIDLHIYPSIQSKADELRAELLRIIPASSHVYVHDTLANDALLVELTGYDYGLHALTPEDDGILQTYRIEKFEYASANKVFDYVDAGLYTFVHNGRFMRFLLQRYGLGEHVSDPMAAISRLGRKEPIRVPEPLLIRNIAARLSEFYEVIQHEWCKRENRYA